MKKITFADTWAFATEKHGAQKDKQGFPYWQHLAAVWQNVRDLGGDEAAQHAAILHDIIEDTPVTAAVLRERGYSEVVIDTILDVSKRSGEPNKSYIGRVIDAGERAQVVKLADLRHNTEGERMAGLPVVTQDRLKFKYFSAISRIEYALDMDYSISDEDYAKSQEYEKKYTTTKTTWVAGSKWDPVTQTWKKPEPKHWDPKQQKMVPGKGPVYDSVTKTWKTEPPEAPEPEDAGVLTAQCTMTAPHAAHYWHSMMDVTKGGSCPGITQPVEEDLKARFEEAKAMADEQIRAAESVVVGSEEDAAMMDNWGEWMD